MSDLPTMTHNIPPASVAQKLRGRAQWAAYQALAAAAGEWVTADEVANAVYQEPSYSWSPLQALKGVIARLRAKGIPVQSWYVVGHDTRYRLPLDWQRAQDTEPGDAGDAS